jgi:hypothetical protein
MADIFNIFISHIHEDDHRLSALKELLSKNGCEARDSSVNSSTPNDAKDPEYIKREILAPRIQWAGTMIVLITPDTKTSEYVAWEIEYAKKLGKRIIGVWDFGDGGCEMPDALDDFANAVVPWRAEMIIDAINGRIEGTCDQDGNPRPPREIARHLC